MWAGGSDRKTKTETHFGKSSAYIGTHVKTKKEKNRI